MNPTPSPSHDTGGASEALAGAPPLLVARLAGRAPDAGQPSRAVLAAALLRIQNQTLRQEQALERGGARAAWEPEEPQPRLAPDPVPAVRRAPAFAGRRRRPFFIPAWTGWAAAAGIALVFAWEHADPFGHRTISGGGRLVRGHPAATDVTGNHSGSADEEAEDSANGESGLPDLGAGPGDSKFKNRGIRLAASTNGKGKYRAVPLAAVQNMAQLRRDLAKLRAANEARFQASPGLSRTVVVEMTDPSLPRDTTRMGAIRLTDRVAESIAAGVSGEQSAASTASTFLNTPADALASANAASSDGSLPSPQTKSPEQALVLSGGDGSWNGDVVIEKGMPNTGVLNLPEGAQIKHLDFPVDSAASYRGLVNLGSGWFYDQFSDLLWQPTGEGHVYTGAKAPAGFDVETFAPPEVAVTPQVVENPTTTASSAPPSTGDGSGAVPQSGSAAGTASAPGGGEAGGSSTALNQIASATPPRGYPIFDETTGSGSIILQNLPDLVWTSSMSTDQTMGLTSGGNSGSGSSFSSSTAAGNTQVYQLWVTDPASAQPISVGIIPQLEGGNGRVWFDLGSPGVAPSGYILTIEPGTGSTVPTGKVVLQGP